MVETSSGLGNILGKERGRGEVWLEGVMGEDPILILLKRKLFSIVKKPHNSPFKGFLEKLTLEVVVLNESLIL